MVELLIVVAIIAILATIAIPVYTSRVEAARVANTVSELSSLGHAILAYQATNDNFPANLGVINQAGATDPWGNPYQYLVIATATPGAVRKDQFLVPINSDFDLYSMGPDGQSVAPLTAAKSRDDIIRANDGGYYGVAEEY